MAQEIKYPDQAIEALGGNNAVAALFGLDVRVVLNWYKRGLPADTYVALAPLLTARGLYFSPALFGQRVLVSENSPTVRLTTQSYRRSTTRSYRRKNGKTVR